MMGWSFIIVLIAAAWLLIPRVFQSLGLVKPVWIYSCPRVVFVAISGGLSIFHLLGEKSCSKSCALGEHPIDYTSLYNGMFPCGWTQLAISTS